MGEAADPAEKLLVVKNRLCHQDIGSVDSEDIGIIDDKLILIANVPLKHGVYEFDRSLRSGQMGQDPCCDIGGMTFGVIEGKHIFPDVSNNGRTRCPYQCVASFP